MIKEKNINLHIRSPFTSCKKMCKKISIKFRFKLYLTHLSVNEQNDDREKIFMNFINVN